MSTVGKTLGDYRLEREIGRGSFGTVYFARHMTTGEGRAIKVLRPEMARDEELRHRLRREAKLAGHFRSPHAVRIDDCAESPDGTVYIVMEFLEGEDLYKLLRRQGKLSPEHVEHIARQTLDVLGEAHTLGVIHRDLKPENLFLCRAPSGEEIVKVFDFGIAKVSGEGSLNETTRLTMSGGLLGTPTYMSPEQCRGETLTPASDLYSFGVVLYELLTGGPPFDDDNAALVLIAHCQSDPPPLPAAVAETLIGKSIIKSLRKDPQDRFTSADEFRATLDGALPIGEPRAGGRTTSAAASSQPPAAMGSTQTAAPSPATAATPKPGPTASNAGAASNPGAASSPAAAKPTDGKSGCAGVLAFVLAVGAAGTLLACCW